MRLGFILKSLLFALISYPPALFSSDIELKHTSLPLLLRNSQEVICNLPATAFDLFLVDQGWTDADAMQCSRVHMWHGYNSTTQLK